MGRWAQARRRGGSGHPPTTAGPPPAPVLRIQVTSLIQDAQGGSDVGGICRLYGSDNDTGPWTEVGFASWLLHQDWGNPLGYGGAWLAAREEGNGHDYVGLSDLSNVIENA